MFALAIFAWLLSLVLIWQSRELRLNQDLIIAGALGIIALLTFSAFYSATGTEGMRTAIAATLFIFYITLITHLIAAQSFRNQLDLPAAAGAVGQPAPSAAVVPSPSASVGLGASAATQQQSVVPFGRDIVNGLTDFVKLVLVFYFGAVTVEKTVSSITTAATARADAQAEAMESTADKRLDSARTERETAQTQLDTARAAGPVISPGRPETDQGEHR